MYTKWTKSEHSLDIKNGRNLTTVWTQLGHNLNVEWIWNDHKVKTTWTESRPKLYLHWIQDGQGLIISPPWTVWTSLSSYFPSSLNAHEFSSYATRFSLICVCLSFCPSLWLFMFVRLFLSLDLSLSPSHTRTYLSLSLRSFSSYSLTSLTVVLCPFLTVSVHFRTSRSFSFWPVLAQPVAASDEAWALVDR